MPLDQRMKTTVTAWQMREVDGEQTFNDHSDADYDASVLQQLAELHADTETWLESLGTAVGRFAAYRGRFERAIAAVQGGRLPVRRVTAGRQLPQRVVRAARGPDPARRPHARGRGRRRARLTPSPPD